ncbi:FtsX-like permease family protein [Luteococcus sp. OSA5]|uniref:FtsX-like permease family protein n=1 Tax=Luteococcus sp. OSA5 TaxID=3401630 RepID=UPI003B433BE8
MSCTSRVEAPVVLPQGEPLDASRVPALGVLRELAGLLGPASIADRSSWALPVSALAVASALSLSVAGGVHHFFSTTGELAGLYRFLSSVALALLLIPLMTLAGAAARLSARRRDTRLSSLRLLGASQATLRLLTLAEAGAIALVGGALGVLGYLALMPVFGLLHFGGGPIGAGNLWIGVLPVLGALLVIVVLAVLSSVLGLRKVEVTPLGVRTRQQAPTTSKARMVIAVLAIAASSVVAKLLGAAPSMGVVLVMMVLMFGTPLLAVNLAGPWLVALVARLDLHRARGPVQLLAARTILEDPKQTWRQVGALGATTFVGVLMGVGMGMASMVEGQRPQDLVVASDIRTGVLLTLAISFVTVACSIGINQTAAVLDRRELYVGLAMVGMPTALIDAARRRAVLRPVFAVVLLSAVAALALVLPLGIINAALEPAAPLTVLAVLVAGMATVWLALLASRATLRQVLAAGLTRSE